MTILKGEHYVVETIDQFINRTKFTKEDIILSCYDEDEVISEINSLYEDIDCGVVESVSGMHPDDVDEYVAEVTTYEAIVTLLKQDDDDWVHLYDGIVHDIVEVYDMGDNDE